MSKLEDFKDMIRGIDDIDSLNSAYLVVSEVLRINEMRQKIDMIEDNLTSDGRAMFYYFAMGLDSEEVPFVAENINGKIRRLMKKNESETAEDGVSDE
jgi:trimethylamine:corrinoid methyltransferase-like protein